MFNNKKKLEKQKKLIVKKLSDFEIRIDEAINVCQDTDDCPTLLLKYLKRDISDFKKKLDN